MKSDASPLLLAMKAQNAKAVKDLLAMDSAVSLRESLRGPKDDYKDGTGPVQSWVYRFNFPDLEEDASVA
jgi:hypothetical protein